MYTHTGNNLVCNFDHREKIQNYLGTWTGYTDRQTEFQKYLGIFWVKHLFITIL